MRFNELRDWLTARGEPSYRLKQLKQALFVQHASSWEEFTVWGKELRAAAQEVCSWNALDLVRSQSSTKGDTTKALFRCQDGAVIEAVLMQHYDERKTVCVSSQVGCAMGCTFCATGTMGWKRNLTADEIVEQVLYFDRLLSKQESRVSNVVFMGMGEPMHNYDAVLEAIRRLNDPDGLCIGARKISISTSGLVPGIERLAQEPLQVNLAISLHAGTDSVRSKMMPINKAYPLEVLMKAVAAYMEATNRRVMFEYLLLRGVNDTREQAVAIAERLRPYVRLVHVNVIKYHDTLAFQATAQPDREQFVEWLRDLGIPATHRVTFGEDIDAACGQLATRETSEGVLQGASATRINRDQNNGV